MKMYSCLLTHCALAASIAIVNSACRSEGNKSTNVESKTAKVDIGTAAKTSAHKDSLEQNGKSVLISKTNYNWHDSVPKEYLLKSYKLKSGVQVVSGGTHRDIVYFFKNGKGLGYDDIKNGDFLNTRGGDSRFEKVWEPPHWRDCNLFPCTNMDFRIVDLNDDVTLVSVRHGGVRDHVAFYRIQGNDIYKYLKIWRDFGPGELENGTAISVDIWGPNNRFVQFKMEGRPWAGDPAVPQPYSHNGIFYYDQQKDSVSYKSNNEKLWIPVPR